MPRARRARYQIDIAPWEIPDGVMLKSSPAPSVTWSATERAMAQPGDAILDDFVRIGRAPRGVDQPARFRHRAAVSFAARWGAWSACACGRPHRALGPDVFSALEPANPPSRWPTPDEVRLFGLGLPPMRSESVADAVTASRAVNALRRIAVDVRSGRHSPHAVWSTLWPGATSDDVERLLGPADSARAVLATMTDSWLQWAHVAPSVTWDAGQPLLRLRVYGSAGALAAAFARELAMPPRTFICENCGVTLARRGNPDEVWCEPCLNAYRARERRATKED